VHIVHNILGSTRSPVQGMPGVDSRLEKRQTHDAFMACTKTAFPLPVSNQHIMYFTGSTTCILLTHKMFTTHLLTYLLSEIVPIILYIFSYGAYLTK
jgi:hypothetical protein